jgi:mannose-6-phosphate isomerase-like protein (cupin superfamily)
MTKYNNTPWGFDLTWVNNDKYSSRILIVREGEKLPYIYHKRQDITLFILQGIVQLVVEGRNKILNEGDTYHISPKLMHRIIALKGDATILESGTKVEDDIVLVEK